MGIRPYKRSCRKCVRRGRYPHRPLQRPPSTSRPAAAGSGAGTMRFFTPTTAPPNSRDETKANERPGASRQKAGRSRRHRFGRPLSARRHKGAGARQKSGLFFWTVQSRSRWRLCRLTDAAYPLRVRPVFFSTRLKRKWGVDSWGEAAFPRRNRRNGLAAIAAKFPRPIGRPAPQTRRGGP